MVREMRERSIDVVILFLNVVAILVLVAILSVMVNTADARGKAVAASHDSVPVSIIES